MTFRSDFAGITSGVTPCVKQEWRFSIETDETGRKALKETSPSFLNLRRSSVSLGTARATSLTREEEEGRGGVDEGEGVDAPTALRRPPCGDLRPCHRRRSPSGGERWPGEGRGGATLEFKEGSLQKEEGEGIHWGSDRLPDPVSPGERPGRTPDRLPSLFFLAPPCGAFRP